ncbi:hypothetical protein Ae505Ps2_2243c [Pseudonocardia sp. Ae505_Ps2]|nr:hypothetical protein Ae505Ps2_2243c [Pseudonocardia sp. Ae505_Ps2]
MPRLLCVDMGAPVLGMEGVAAPARWLGVGVLIG